MRPSHKRNIAIALGAIVIESPRNADVSLTTRPAEGVNVRCMKTPQTIGVIGAGIMGAGIAQACLVAGLSVVMIDVDAERIAHARSAISDVFRRRYLP
jgi:predicted homoserine dehydrogenase-like protein